MTLFLGVDISTTGAKAVLIRADGSVAASAAREYPLSNPRPLHFEQDPADWWSAACAAIRAACGRSGSPPDAIAAVGLTGQMHGLTLIDAAGQVLRPAILWCDQRTGAECDEITRRAGGLDRVLALTGNAVLPGFTAPKILWVERNEPGLRARIAKVLLPKDYVRFRLTGDFVSDVSDASGTCLLDVARRRWSDEMCAISNVPRAWLPDVVESPVAASVISPDGARATGLRAGIPVVGGAGDQAAQAIGTGTVRGGTVSLTLGTSGVVFAPIEAFAHDPMGRLHAFCHAAPGRWHLMGVMLAAGGSFRWVRDALAEAERAAAAEAGEDPYDLLTREAGSVPAGSDGLIFLPYLTGERTPHPDPEARGAFIGLTLGHRKAHLIRAVMEGVAFGLRDSLEIIGESTGMGGVTEIRCSGGGSRSPLWRAILADILGIPIIKIGEGEGAAFGAALLAAVGAGVFRSVEEAASCGTQSTGRTDPDPERTEMYNRMYATYHSLYPILRTSFHDLGGIAAGEARPRC